LQSGAVFYPGAITIIKDAQPDTVRVFSFTATGPAVSNFSLDDDGDITNTYSNTQNFANLTNFGPSHTVTVTEAFPGGGYALTGLTCASDPNGGTGTNNNTISIPNRQVEIMLEEGELVTCTFVNTFIPTAATASISGQVTDFNGHGIYNVRLTLTKVSTGETIILRTNPFGYYSVQELATGENYVITLRSKRYVFNPDSRILSLFENINDLNFQAEPLE
jgi:hypothetical protein